MNALTAVAGLDNDTVRMPPGPALPKALQGVLFSVFHRRMLQRWTARYGDAFTITVPLFGQTLIVTDPELARQVFLTSPDAAANGTPNLSRVVGADSVFALNGAEHRRRRKLLSPPLHGTRVRAHEQLVVEETLREISAWPEHGAFATLEPMTRITLNVILRAVFGADGPELDDLRRIIPAWVTLASRLALLPMPARRWGRFTPWGRLDALRRQYEIVVDRLISKAHTDPDLDQRTDILSWLLHNDREAGTSLSRKELGDELLTLLTAGHETTAVSLAWLFERLTRQPALLEALADEARTEQNTLRRAATREVQRTRPALVITFRRVTAATIRIGQWVVPRGATVVVAIEQIHRNPQVFPDPERFDPRRYLDGCEPPAFGWIPYGGGSRRCPGSALADLELDVVLRTVLRHFIIEPTTRPDEKWHGRGVAFAPKKGGIVRVRRIARSN